MKKGMLNKKYRRTEEAILEVLFKMNEMPSVGELARRARISRSTLYRHHRAIPGIVPDYEKEVIGAYWEMMKRILKREKVDLKNIFLRTLLFILRQRKKFQILFRYEGSRAVERMIMKLETIISVKYHLPKNSTKMMRIYVKEVAGAIEMWGDRGFPEEEMMKVLNDIMYLTETMRSRLVAIIE